MTLRLNKFNKTIGAILGAFAVLTLLVIAANRQAGRQVIVATSAANNQRGVLGESFQTKGYVLTLGEVKSYPADETTATKRVVAEAVITNSSGTVLQLSPGLQISIMDSSGGTHMATARYLDYGVVIGGPTGPGENARINIDFDIPADTMPNSFIFQKDAATEPTVVGL